MAKKSKGLATRETIVTKAREVFNDLGTGLTLKDLSSHMDMPISRITNHFPTKDDLFLGIAEDYEAKYTPILSQPHFTNGFNLQGFWNLLSAIMDLQFEYRSLMLFACSTGLNQEKVINQFTSSWKDNLEGFNRLMQMMVSTGILKPESLQDEHLNIIRFQHINLLTTWLVSYTLYDRGHHLARQKSIYLKGIFLAFHPYLTPKGMEELELILANSAA